MPEPDNHNITTIELICDGLAGILTTAKRLLLAVMEVS